MLVNPWSLALCLLAGLSLFLLGMASKTALRVMRSWQPASDSARQIGLEAEIWLSSTLVQYGLAFQVISLFLFVLAADHFSGMLAGAMCATGSLLANDYGLPLLAVKGTGIFLYGGWIVFHQLDISSETYPLVRFKYILLLCLLPFVVADAVLLILYLTALQPDIITSCCAIIFDAAPSGTVQNLVGGRHGQGLLLLHYGWAALLFAAGLVAWRRRQAFFYLLYGVGMLLFFGLALTTLVAEISSYIYAMPFHNCPFCMLKKEYGYFGFLLYIPLFFSVFCGVMAMVVELVKSRPGLGRRVAELQRVMVAVSLGALLLYSTLSAWHYLLYLVAGGEG
ncbi:MAG: hypothetical protein C0613_05230 [Desulfobulbaceae bacterium]|nr:MAG: hypothetical protein C0613_05230 [Desulfobulbaceae bacterium]